MRAVAASCVVMSHCALFGGALGPSLAGRLLAHLNVGVTIFFLISGFLLYRPFIAHRCGGPPPPRVGDYAKRRVLRIYPAYWLVLTVLLVIPGLPSVDYESVWPMYALLHTLPVGTGLRCSQLVIGCGLAQTWSLVAEVTFYAALPLFVLLVGRLTDRLSVRAWISAQALTLTALSALSVVLQFAVFNPAPQWVGWSVAGNVLWFALGMGMAVASAATTAGATARRLASWVSAHAGLLWATAVACYVALSVWLPPTPFVIATDQRVVVHLAFGLIAMLLLAPMIFAATPERRVQRLVGGRLLGWLGLISYGVFLWHYPVVLKLSQRHGGLALVPLLLGTVAITVPIAAASYYVLERPLMRLKYRSATGRLTPRAPEAG